jgi:hypothetical protein
MIGSAVPGTKRILLGDRQNAKHLNDFSVAQAFTPGNEGKVVSKSPLMGL